MSLSSEELAAIRERAEKATEGPWETTTEDLEVMVRNESGTLDAFSLGYVGNRTSGADANFIAHAREDVPRLVAEVERLTGELDECAVNARGWKTNYTVVQARLDKVRALHRPVDVEPSDTICAGCSTLRGSGESLRYFPTEEWPCPTIQALDGSDQ